MKETFHIFGGGDNSVGIPSTAATITIDDNFNDDKYDKLTMIKTWKEFLHEYYDNGNITILTDEEFDSYCLSETEAMNCERI
jgi:hypothetical protein